MRYAITSLRGHMCDSIWHARLIQMNAKFSSEILQRLSGVQNAHFSTYFNHSVHKSSYPHFNSVHSFLAAICSIYIQCDKCVHYFMLCWGRKTQFVDDLLFLPWDCFTINWFLNYTRKYFNPSCLLYSLALYQHHNLYCIVIFSSLFRIECYV